MCSALLRTAVIVDQGARQAGGRKRPKEMLYGKGQVLSPESPPAGRRANRKCSQSGRVQGSMPLCIFQTF